MTGGPSSAVIFDVDGVLLHLTGPEEDAFFTPFEHLYGLTGLSRDWDSYKVRNDEDIISEILNRHLGTAPDGNQMARLIATYHETMRAGLATGAFTTSVINGTGALLDNLAAIPGLVMGMATANLASIAAMRLRHAGLWHHVKDHPGGAEGGGAKAEILKRVLDRLQLAPDRVVFIGDNLNDVAAGLVNGVHFIGFCEDEQRRTRLAAAGATALSGDHATTLALIRSMLDPG